MVATSTSPRLVCVPPPMSFSATRSAIASTSSSSNVMRDRSPTRAQLIDGTLHPAGGQRRSAQRSHPLGAAQVECWPLQIETPGTNLVDGHRVRLCERRVIEVLMGPEVPVL